MAAYGFRRVNFNETQFFSDFVGEKTLGLIQGTTSLFVRRNLGLGEDRQLFGFVYEDRVNTFYLQKNNETKNIEVGSMYVKDLENFSAFLFGRVDCSKTEKKMTAGTLEFARFMRNVINNIDSGSNIKLKPTTCERERFYRRIFKNNPNVEIISSED